MHCRSYRLQKELESQLWKVTWSEVKQSLKIFAENNDVEDSDSSQCNSYCNFPTLHPTPTSKKSRIWRRKASSTLKNLGKTSKYEVSLLFSLTVLYHLLAASAAGAR